MPPVQMSSFRTGFKADIECNFISGILLFFEMFQICFPYHLQLLFYKSGAFTFHH